MTPHLPFRLGTALLAAILFFGGECIPSAEAHGGGGHGGHGGHAGGHLGGHPGYGGAYRHYGYGYRGRYYGGYAPFGYGLGAGLLLGAGFGYGRGAGFYRPYYGYGYGAGGYGLGVGGYGGYPYYAVYGYGATGPAKAGPSGPPVPGLTPPPANRPAPDDAAHLELLVPTDAEVLFDGKKTSQKGRARHFVSPPLDPNRIHTYEVVVRYTDPSGKVVTDRRNIDVRTNDWFSIDFTRPAPSTAEPPPAAPVP